jgi:uncharacterized protein Usg
LVERVNTYIWTQIQFNAKLYEYVLNFCKILYHIPSHVELDINIPLIERYNALVTFTNYHELKKNLLDTKIVIRFWLKMCKI